MKKIRVFKNGLETHCAFESLDGSSGLKKGEIDVWLSFLLASSYFGKPERWVTQEQEDISNAIETRQVEVTPAVVDEQGQVIEPAVFATEYKLAAEYQIVVEDISAEIEAKNKKQEKAKQRQEKIKKYDIQNKLNSLTNTAKVKEFLADLLPDLLEYVSGTQVSIPSEPEDPSFAYYVNTLQILSSSGAIVLNNKMRQIVYITGDKESVTLNAIRPISNGFIDGQEVKIVGSSDVNPVTIMSAGNVRLNGSITLGDGESLDLFWDSKASVWRESSRSE